MTKEYGLYDPEYKAARRVNYLIDKERQGDRDATGLGRH